MMENMADGIEAIEVASNSSGSALQENERYLDSIEGKTNKLAATYESLAVHLMNSDFLKFVLDVGDGALTVIDKLAASSNSLSILTGAVFTAISAFGNFRTGIQYVNDETGQLIRTWSLLGKSIDDISADMSRGKNIFEAIFSGYRTNQKDGLTEIDIEDLIQFDQKILQNNLTIESEESVKQLNDMSIAAQQFAHDMADGKVQVDELSVGMKKMAGAAQIGRAALTALSQVGLMLVVTAAMTVITEFVSYVQKTFYPTLNQLRERAQESNSAFDDTISSIKSMNSELTTTKDRIHELQDMGVLSIAEQDELDNLQKRRVELEAQLQLEKELSDLQYQKAQQDVYTALQKADYPKKLADAYNDRDEIEDKIGRSKNEQEVEDLRQKLAEADQELAEMISEIKDLEPEKYIDDSATGQLLESAYDPIMMPIVSHSETPREDALSYFLAKNEDIAKQLEEAQKQGEITKEVIENIFTEENLQEVEKYKLYLDNLAETYKNVENAANAANESASISNLQETMDGVSKYIDSYNENGYLTPQEVYEMLQENSDYVQYLIKGSDGQYLISEDMITDYENAEKVMSNMIDDYVKAQEGAYYGTRELAEGIADSLASIYEESKLPTDLLDSLQLDVLADINTKFVEGDIDAKDYFSNLSAYSESVDFSAFKNNINDLDLTVQQSLMSIFTSLTQGMDYLTRQYSTGAISFNEFFDSTLEAAKSASSYYSDMKEAIEEPEELESDDGKSATLRNLSESLQTEVSETASSATSASKTVSESLQTEIVGTASAVGEANDALDEFVTNSSDTVKAYEDMTEASSELNETIHDAEDASDFVNFMSDFSETVEEFNDGEGHLEFTLPDIETSQYQEFAAGLSSVLDGLDEKSSLFKVMADAATNATGQTIETTDQLRTAITTNCDAMNAAVNAASGEVGNITSSMLSNVGTVLTAIASLIKDFKATIDITVDGSQKVTLASILGRSLDVTIPQSITFSGGLDDTKGLAGALTEMGNDYTTLGKLSNATASDIASQGNKSNGNSTSKKAAAPTSSSGSSSADDTAEKIADINEKLKELDEEEHLDQLKKSIEEVQLLIDQFDASLDMLDLSLELTSELDYARRMELVASQFDVATQKGATLRDEFERLANTTPQTADEAQELANRLEELGSEIRDNMKSVVEYRNELDRIRLKSITSSAENVMDQLEREEKLLDRNISALIDGSMIGGTGAFSFDFLLPELPEDALDGQRKENKALEDEEQRHQDVINEIKRKALDMQYEKLAEEREKERQQILKDLEGYKADIGEAKASTISAAEETGTAITSDASQTQSTLVSGYDTAGADAVSAFMSHFDTMTSELSVKAASSAATFATSFATALAKSGDPIKSSLSAAIKAGLQAGAGGLSEGDYPTDTVVGDAKSVTSFYSNGHNKYGGTHALDKGIDYAHPKGTPIPAAWAGEVVRVADLGRKSYGKYVTIQSSDGKNHVYAHMSQQNVRVGQKVARGQIIGYVGSTGKSTGPHVHVSNAWGTYIDTTGRATGGIVQPNEQTLAGEEGREIAKLPNGKIIMLGEHGAELYDLPADTKIIDHKQTEEILKYTGHSIVGKRVKQYGKNESRKPAARNVPSTATQQAPKVEVPMFASGVVDPEWVRLAQQIQKQYGIPASLTLAQLILETGWGTSSAARNKNNYFGIMKNGTTRSFSSMAESFQAYAKNLLYSGYYNVSGLSSTDFNGWIHSIAETYAPNQNYEAKVKQVAAYANLTQYDNIISDTATAASDASTAAKESLSEVEKARQVVEKYTEIPQAYSKEFILSYRDYAEQRSKNLQDVDTMLKIDPERAREIIDTQREHDIQTSYEMKLDLYTNAADKLKKNYNDLLAEFDKIKDTADADVLKEYIDGLAEIQDKIYELDESLKEAAHDMYLYGKNSLDNQLKLLNYQYNEAEFYHDYASMTVNYQKQLAIYEEQMKNAAAEADRIRKTGASEDAEYIQECIDDWWEAREAIREYRQELKELVDQQKEDYKDTLSDFQNSYIDIFNNAIRDLQYQKDTDPLLKSLYDQRDALEEINEEREDELALMRAKEDLAKLQKTNLVYQKGVGWVYMADENALREAQENLANVENDKTLSDLDKQIEEREEFFDDNIDALQEFIDKLEYEMEVYLREGATSIAELIDLLNQLGIDSYDNVMHATNWLQDVLDAVNADDLLSTWFNNVTGTPADEVQEQFDRELYISLLKEMVRKEQAIEDADENTQNILRNEINSLAEQLGLIYKDGKYWTDEGVDAYLLLAEMLQQEMQQNTEAMKDSDTLHNTLLQSTNDILQALYDYITGRDDKNRKQQLLEEMIQNSTKWLSADAEERKKLHARNVEIGKELGLTYSPGNGVWYTDDDQTMEAYAEMALAIMKKNSAAWLETDSQNEKDWLHSVNNILGKMFGLTYKNGSWYYPSGLKAYSQSSVIDYDGYAFAHGGGANELVLNNADVAKLYSYIHNTPDIFARAMNDVHKSISATPTPEFAGTPSESTVYHIDGDIHVHDVQDPDGFANAIKMEFGNLIDQKGMR